VDICPQDAIYFKDFIRVDAQKCIGCEKCKCENISYNSFHTQNFKEELEKVKKYKVDIIELHIATFDMEDIFYKWNTLCEYYSGVLSICADRSKYSDEDLLKLLSEMIEIAGKERVIIQADGNPMSGGEDTYQSTLQAIACAGLMKDLGVPVFISGGTNSKTAQLAQQCNVRYNGITIGSYARKIVKNLDHLLYYEAVNAAKALVDSVKDRVYERQC